MGLFLSFFVRLLLFLKDISGYKAVRKYTYNTTSIINTNGRVSKSACLKNIHDLID